MAEARRYHEWSSWLADGSAHRLGPGDLHIWRVAFGDGMAAPEDMSRVLSPGEQARADAFRFPQHRAGFVTTRHALRLVLGSVLQADPAGLVLRTAPLGKPELATPLPDGRTLAFNVSHSGTMALIAVCLLPPGSPGIGVDIEQMRPVANPLDIARRVLAPADTAALAKEPKASLHSAFYRLWVRREAVLKAEGTGLAGIEDGELQPETGTPWQVADLLPGTGYAGAVAHASPGARIFQWSFERPPAFRAFGLRRHPAKNRDHLKQD